MNRYFFAIRWRVRQVLEKLFVVLNPKGSPICVYTMGKVGSTSIYFALKGKLGWQVSFVHRFNPENILKYNQPFLANGIKPHHSKHSIWLNKKFRNRKIKIITLFRDPLKRNISDFFQDFRVYNNGLNFHEVPIEKAIQNYFSNYPHNLADDWIKHELCPTLNVDVDDLRLGQSKYKRIESKNVSALILRTTLGDKEKLECISDFLSEEIVSFPRLNTAKSKAYSDYYTEFQETINYTEEFLNSIYSSECYKIIQ